ncbi:MAG: small multi-drug export protein, partial [Oribacterium sp.]
MENLVSFLISKLGTVLSKELLVFLISLMPVLELRGGLLAASLLRLNYPLALLLCIVGNLLPIPLVLLFIERFVNFLERFPIS